MYLFFLICFNFGSFSFFTSSNLKIHLSPDHVLLEYFRKFLSIKHRNLKLTKYLINLQLWDQLIKVTSFVDLPTLWALHHFYYLSFLKCLGQLVSLSKMCLLHTAATVICNSLKFKCALSLVTRRSANKVYIQHPGNGCVRNHLRWLHLYVNIHRSQLRSGSQADHVHGIHLMKILNIFFHSVKQLLFNGDLHYIFVLNSFVKCCLRFSNRNLSFCIYHATSIIFPILPILNNILIMDIVLTM